MCVNMIRCKLQLQKSVKSRKLSIPRNENQVFRLNFSVVGVAGLAHATRPTCSHCQLESSNLNRTLTGRDEAARHCYPMIANTETSIGSVTRTGPGRPRGGARSSVWHGSRAADLPQ
jgi:hypothetical protein